MRWLSPDQSFDPADTAFAASRRKQQVTLRRRAGLLLLLGFLCSIIVLYVWVTDAAWVREKAESLIAEQVGGHVTIDHASLSVFDGLRLSDVRVYAGEDARPGTELFYAERIWVRVGMRKLLEKRLEAEQILVVKPEVHLTENLDTGKWNFESLKRDKRDKPREPATASGRPTPLPEVLLRGGKLIYTQYRGGQALNTRTIAIDGQVTPVGRETGRLYRFDFEGRWPREAVGTRLRGLVDIQRKVILAGLGEGAPPGDLAPRGLRGFEKHAPVVREVLDSAGAHDGQGLAWHPLVEDFEFGEAVRVMLPAQVQEWWERHGLAGRIRIPRFYYSWAREPKWQVEVELRGVRMSLPPEEVMGKRQAWMRRMGRPGFALAALSGAGPSARWETLESAIAPQPLEITGVSGRFMFTPEQITFDEVSGRVEGNLLEGSGEISEYAKYAGDAPVNVRLRAPDMGVSPWPRWLSVLPRDLHRLWHEIRPAGRGALLVDLWRREPSGPVEIGIELRVRNGEFCFHELPYPLRSATGTVRYRKDARGEERLDLVGIEGYGLAGTANHNTRITVDGFIGPLDKRSQVEVKVTARNVTLDHNLRVALPPDAREVLDLFDIRRADGTIEPLHLNGDFSSRMYRPRGLGHKLDSHIDLDVRQASGAFVEFPYPLREGHGRIEVRTRHAMIRGFSARNGRAEVNIDGSVFWGNGKTVEPLLQITARNVPINADLRNALPAAQGQWLDKLDVAGVMDVRGSVFLLPFEELTRRQRRLGWIVADAQSIRGHPVAWDITMDVREARLWPVAGTHAVTDATAELHLTDQALEIRRFSGTREISPVLGNGRISWESGSPRLYLDIRVPAAALDRTMYALVPEGAQRVWDELRPEGRMNLRVVYHGGGISGAVDGSGKPLDDTFLAQITPLEGALTLRSMPWRLEKLSGTATVRPGVVELDKLSGRHGDAVVQLSGQFLSESRQSLWTLSATGENLMVDDELRKALPVSLAELLKAVDYRGKLSFDCPKFVYRSEEAAASTTKPASRAAETSRIDFDGSLKLLGGQLDVGMPLSEVVGSVDLRSVAIRDGRLHSLVGSITVPTLLLADRPGRDFRSDIVKAGGRDIYQFANLQGKILGGELAGQIDVQTPEHGSPRYAMAAVLRNCDVRQILSEQSDKLKGRMTASLAMEGHWSDVRTRRGRGDIQVEGNDLYKVPVMLGLMQITNLSLPIKSPFNEATAQYSVEGQRVTLEQITLRARDMVMQGSGWLDFASKKVSMSFTTDNPNWPDIPVIGELIRGVKKELLQIQVRGTITEPKVGARSLNTFATTVDQVFEGKSKDDNGGGRR